MVRGKIRFNSPDDVVNFVKIVSKFNVDIDIKQRAALLDGKSVEGLMALQLQTELECIMHESMNNCASIIEAIQQYSISDFTECK